MTRRSLALLASLLALLIIGGAWPPAPVAAQAPAAGAVPAFEVASIRRNTSGTGMVSMNMAPGGRMNFVNVAVRQLIVRAYEVQPFQVIGGPDWLTNERYDIIAKAEGDASPAQLNLMLQQLLADRFKLVVRRETRELPVYYLVQARDDGRLGPALKPAAVECGPQGRGRPGGPPAAAPGAGAGRGGPGAGCQMMIAAGRLQAGGQPMSQFASVLANQVGRPIIDKTGLTGGFDIELSWMPEGRGNPVGPLPNGVQLPAIDPDAPSLFTAVQEQLGLKLEAGRGPVEVLVIDNVQPPTAD